MSCGVSWRLGIVASTDDTSSMNFAKRRELASRLLDGYVHGPAAATAATTRALAKVATAQNVVLVEGISDQIAVETLARRRDRDLDAEGVVVLPIGGAHAIARYLALLGPDGAGLGSPETQDDLEGLGFYVCVEDLEDELIRSIGVAQVEVLIDSQGDLG